MTSHRGWISSAALITEEEFSRVGYTEPDFSFDAQTRPHRAMIVRAVNKIRQEDPRCKDHLSPGSVSLSRDRSKPREPVFFGTCGKGTGVVNVYFSQSDLAEGKTFAPPAHIDRSRAVDLCEAYAKRHSRFPSTVDFSRFWSLGVTDHPNGRTTVVSSFKAKNAFNLQLTFDIRCLLDQRGLIEAHIAEQ